MSDTKISNYPDGGDLQDTDEVVVARAGENRKIAGDKFGGVTQPFDTVEITPDGSQLYGLLITALAGFADVYNAYIRILDADGAHVFNIDDGGIDMKPGAGAGADATHILLRNTLGTSSADLSSENGLALTRADVGHYLTMNPEEGFRFFGFVPINTPGTGYAQIYYDPTPGDAKLVVRAKDSNGDLVTGEVALTP